MFRGQAHCTQGVFWLQGSKEGARSSRAEDLQGFREERWDELGLHSTVTIARCCEVGWARQVKTPLSSNGLRSDREQLSPTDGTAGCPHSGGVDRAPDDEAWR